MSNALGIGQRYCEGNADIEFFTPEFKATAIKVGLYVAGVLAKIVDFASNIIPPIGLSKLYNYCFNKSLNEGINQAQLESYQKALLGYKEDEIQIFKSEYDLIQKIGTPALSIQSNNTLIINQASPKDKLSKNDLISFDAKFNAILKKIIMGMDEEMGIQSEEIRSDINNIVQSTVYQALKFETEERCISILQLLAYAGNAADGIKPIKEYGEKVRTRSAGTAQTAPGLALSLNDLNNQSDALCFNRNDMVSGLWWSITHPQTLVHLGVSNIDPLAFEADKGNIPFRAGTINVPGIEEPIPLTFGPTPSTTDASYFDALLPYLQKNDMTEVRFMLTSQNGGELERGKAFYEKTKEFREDGTLALITLPFDMQPMKDPLGFMENEQFNIDDFMSKYADFITNNCRKENFERGDIIPLIPENILSKEDLEGCFEFTKNTFLSKFPHGGLSLLSKEEKIKLATSMQLLTQSIMVVTALSNIGKTKKIANLSIACKQCVDRAVALISAVVLLNEIAFTENPNSKSILSEDPMINFKNGIQAGVESPPELSGETSNFIHGIVMGRSQIVDQRLIMEDRLKILMDFMDILFGGIANEI